MPCKVPFPLILFESCLLQISKDAPCLVLENGVARSMFMLPLPHIVCYPLDRLCALYCTAL